MSFLSFLWKMKSLWSLERVLNPLLPPPQRLGPGPQGSTLRLWSTALRTLVLPTLKVPFYASSSFSYICHLLVLFCVKAQESSCCALSIFHLKKQKTDVHECECAWLHVYRLKLKRLIIRLLTFTLSCPLTLLVSRKFNGYPRSCLTVIPKTLHSISDKKIF